MAKRAVFEFAQPSKINDLMNKYLEKDARGKLRFLDIILFSMIWSFFKIRV
jgi:hypothetical protein